MSKKLVAYFSAEGTTKKVAAQIAEFWMQKDLTPFWKSLAESRYKRITTAKTC